MESVNNYTSMLVERFWRHLSLVRKYRKIPARDLASLKGRITVAHKALKVGSIGGIHIGGKIYPAYLLSYSGEDVNIGDKVKVLIIQDKRLLCVTPVTYPPS